MFATDDLALLYLWCPAIVIAVFPSIGLRRSHLFVIFIFIFILRVSGKSHFIAIQMVTFSCISSPHPNLRRARRRDGLDRAQRHCMRSYCSSDNCTFPSCGPRQLCAAPSSTSLDPCSPVDARVRRARFRARQRRPTHQLRCLGWTSSFHASCGYDFGSSRGLDGSRAVPR